MPPRISYAQRFEDLYLLRCFENQPSGFYIDIGAGHPVHDNVSFAFYLKGWSGITVEPNPALARLSKAVRPRDRIVQTLVGASAGEATFHLVREFHGFSTMVEDHARSAQREFGKESDAISLPVMRLRDLCEQHAPAAIDFLKVDVEGAEDDVLRGGDWQRFRPKVVLAEALAPFTLAPAWESWEPILLEQGYRYACFDSLNRYYVAEEEAELARRLETAPQSFDDVVQFGMLPPALDGEQHPDHHFAQLMARAGMAQLPLLDGALLLQLATADVSAAELEREATPADLSFAWKRLFGLEPSPEQIAAHRVRVDATVRDVYSHLIDSEEFRSACGRVSASHAF